MKETRPKSFMLHGCSIVGGGSHIIGDIFADKLSQHIVYGLMLFQSPWIIDDASPQIIATLLTQIIKWL